MRMTTACSRGVHHADFRVDAYDGSVLLAMPELVGIGGVALKS